MSITMHKVASPRRSVILATYKDEDRKRALRDAANYRKAGMTIRLYDKDGKQI